MTITHYYPWARAQRFDHDVSQVLDSVLGDNASTWSPRVDVREEDSRYVILADVAGVDPKDIDVSMDKNVLTIKGERKPEAPVEGAKATRVERSHGGFKRSFSLPETANADAITAAGKHGVLEISIPKKAELAPRKIEITH
ncbi:MAG: Hsp20/alpha crystallin family protein [Rudaea sp.]